MFTGGPPSSSCVHGLCGNELALRRGPEDEIETSNVMQRALVGASCVVGAIAYLHEQGRSDASLDVHRCVTGAAFGTCVHWT